MEAIYVFSHGSSTAISFGRTAEADDSGANSGYTIGFTGGASAAGTWVVLATSNNTAAGGAPSAGTGAAWVAGGSNPSNGGWWWYKKCNVSEPTTYTITYSGANKNDASATVMTEILNANATNPDGSVGNANATTTAPSVVSSATSDCVVTLQAAGNGTPPAGYTTLIIPVSQSNGSSVIAGKLLVGSGTISPGTWGGGTPAICGTIAFKL